VLALESQRKFPTLGEVLEPLASKRQKIHSQRGNPIALVCSATRFCK
jgi:hypothetical protein